MNESKNSFPFFFERSKFAGAYACVRRVEYAYNISRKNISRRGMIIFLVLFLEQFHSLI